MLRVTADTNIFISSLVFPGGKPFQLLQLARAGKINLTVSEAILDEIAGVLARKFGWQPDDIAEARKWITGIARTATPVVQLNVIKEDPADDRILECAVAAGRIILPRVITICCAWGSKRRDARHESIDFLTLFQSREHER